MSPGNVNLGSWLFRVVAWDGLLPAFILMAPTVIEVLMPNNRGAIEVVAVLLPIAAFFVRITVGKRQIASNNCGIVIRRLQLSVFCLAVLCLVLIDAVLILSHVMPKGAMFANNDDNVVWVIVLSLYLASMAVAMYPGRTKSAPAVV